MRRHPDPPPGGGSTGGALALATFVAACGSAAPRSSVDHPLDQQPAPRVEGRTLRDGRAVLMPAPGHVAVIDFWATWCEACGPQAASLEALWRAHRAAGLRVVGVADDDNPGVLRDHVQRLGLTYPMVMGEHARRIFGAYRVTDLPRLFVVDAAGRVDYVAAGEPGAVDAVRAEVERLISEQR